MSKHTAAKSRSTADVWFVLAITGGTSATLQIWHATHSGGVVPLIATLVGIVPAAAAIGLSHVVAGHKSAAALRLITFAVMLAVMAASASAVAAVVRPIDGRVFSWVFGLALDAAALACVWVLLGDHDRKAAEATALQVAESTAAEARTATAEATARASGLETELARVSAELTAARAAAEALRSTAPVPPRRPRKRARVSGDTQDLTTELRAMQMLDAHPELRAKGQGSELGRRLGVSAATGRRLHASLTAEDRSAERAAQVAHEQVAQPDGEQGTEHAQSEPLA